MQSAIGAVLMLAASLAPTKGWFAPSQPLNVTVKAEGEASLVLTDFNGRAMVKPMISASTIRGTAIQNCFRLDTPYFRIVDTRKRSKLKIINPQINAKRTVQPQSPNTL